MTAASDNMAFIHRLLDCAYAEYNATDYVANFIDQRRADLAGIAADSGGGSFTPDGFDADAVIGSFPGRNSGSSLWPGDLRDGFATRQLLAYALGRLTAAQDPGVPCLEAIELLQKRFEVNHRLFTRYDGAVRRLGDDYTDMRVYALCAAVLMALFRLNNNFSYLNTAIKLNHVLLSSGWPIDPVDLPLIRAAVHWERAIVVDLHEKYTF